jgi:peptidoglycan hydrolase CwlO-like protein
MYANQVTAERAKIDAYQSKVNAYSARIQAAQTKSGIALSRLRTEVEQAQAQVGVYRAKIDGYVADLRGQVETINVYLAKYQADTSLYQADYAYLVKAMETNAQLSQFENAEKLENAKIAQTNARIQLDAWIANRQIKNQSAGTAGGYYGARAQAALNGINALVSAASA